jgi:UDPglucose 6-dehydrogenase
MRVLDLLRSLRSLVGLEPKPMHILQIGTGVVGYAYVKAYKSIGCKVTGLEASRQLIDKYKDETTMYNIDDDLTPIKDVDFVMISINTPLKGDDLDMTYLFSSVKNVAVVIKNSPKAQVVIRSTIVPTVSDTYKEMLEKTVGHTVDVLFQPEFLRAVSAEDDALHPWHIILGAKEATNTDKLIELYCMFDGITRDKITQMPIDEAELFKMFHNCYNAAKISWFNQADLLCRAINRDYGKKIDISVITKVLPQTCEGIINKKYGLTTGHGYYGTCLPKDSAALAKLEKKHNLEVPLFASVVNVNHIMVAQDKEPVLNGDNHVPYNQF